MPILDINRRDRSCITMILKRRGVLWFALGTISLLAIEIPLHPETRLWMAIVWTALTSAFWGLRKARRSRRWVADETLRHPEGDYSTAVISAVNHLIVHWVLFLVQVYTFLFSLWLGLRPLGTVPAPSPGLTTNQKIFTAWLLALEITLTVLNFVLVYRRTKLVANVRRIGG